MTTVQEMINLIESQQNYVLGSLIIKNYDDRGLVLKWLIKNNDIAERKEIFVQLNEDESHIDVKLRSALESIEIQPAG